jgi:hypothetical protein
LGVEALLVKLAELARKKATILCGGVDFCLFLLLTPVLTRRPLLFKEKKNPPSFFGRRERETHFVALYSSNTKSETHFFSFFFNKCKGNRGRETHFSFSSIAENI